MGSGILEGAVDLFGLPLLVEKGRGRPAHVWTPENSNVVNLLFACGRKPIDVARVLGLSYPTFRKHYFNEISASQYAALKMRALQLARLNTLAAAGNVSAEKALAGMIQAERVTATNAAVKARSSEIKAPAMGKKEAAREAAQSATGRFARRAPPAQAQLLN